MAELRAVDMNDFPLQACDACGYTWMSDDASCPKCTFQPADPRAAMLIDWAEFWARDPSQEDWCIWPIVPAGRGVALFAPAKAGKSLVVLALVALAATGQPSLDGSRRDPIDILYLDYEMTLDDLQERLEALGYGPDSDLSHLHYASLPSLPPLNEAEGTKALLELVEMTGAKLVVIDTFSRAVVGEENDNNVGIDFYRWTGLALKAAQVAFLRTDHAGKDVTKGQRGGSAKNDDVDLVWQLVRVQGGVELKTTHRRIGWVPEVVKIKVDDSTGWELSLTEDAAFPAGTKELAELLEHHGIGSSESFTTANRALKAAEGRGRQKGAILAAQRFRRMSEERDGLIGLSVPSGSVPGRNGSHHDLPGAVPVPVPAGTARTGSGNRSVDEASTSSDTGSGTGQATPSSTRPGTGPEPPEPGGPDVGLPGSLPMGRTGTRPNPDDDWEAPF